MDLRTAVIAAFDKLLSEQKVEKIIQEQLEKTVRSVIAESLREYGDFGKQVKEAVAKSFALNGELELPTYNATILKIVRAQVERHTHNVIERQVAKNLEQLLEPPPAEIKLSALIEQYLERVKRDREGGCVCYGEEQITLIDDPRDYDFRYLHLDDEANKKKYDCDIVLGINRDGKIFSLRFRNQELENQMFAGPFYGFERMLFQMKAAGTKLIFDVDPSEIDTGYVVGHHD